MRIITKVFANRLEYLPVLISEYQSDFIKGRLISDNVLMAHDLMHCIKHQRKGGEDFLAVKIDTSKAYDRVNWKFLRMILTEMGFDNQWVDRVLR